MEVQPTIAVANYFVGKAQAEGAEITPMKLLKLVYIAHGWSLGLFDKPLIGEEVQAWKYGPVVESVYQDFKHYGRGRILRQHAVPIDGQLSIPTVTDTPAQELLDTVWEAYQHLDGLQLSDITHERDTPWDIVWNQSNGKTTRRSVIPPELIAAHYKGLAAKRRESLNA